jgi:hypothetical protein
MGSGKAKKGVADSQRQLACSCLRNPVLEPCLAEQAKGERRHGSSQSLRVTLACT